MEITRNAADGCMELTITGRLDGYWADHLDTGLTETVRDGHHRLRLNLVGRHLPQLRRASRCS